ncbi:MAG: RluA family pseudouridine synthase [Spirochaetaceae bacterium]|nr:RluA family pseudouridine synthase [Spirochaetaceae bacterium]
MEFKEFILQKDDANRRIDRILKKLLPTTSLSVIYKSLRSGFIKINNKKISQDYKTNEKDILRIPLFLLSEESHPEKTVNKPKKNLDLNSITLFKNEHILILNKPYGISVHTGNNNEITLQELVIKNFSTNSVSFKPGPLHRIDKNTTGIIIFSQSLLGAQIFSEVLQKHHIKKEYLAILEGTLQEKIELRDTITKNDKTSSFKTMKISNSTLEGKEAISLVTPINWGILKIPHKEMPITLANIEITTGRKHQIRLQCAHKGFPLLGDTAYGGTQLPNIFGQNLFLHDWKMTFEEKTDILNIPSSIQAPLPENFLRLLEKCLKKDDSHFIL